MSLVPSTRAQVDVAVRLEPVLNGLRQPLDLRQPADGSGRLFIAQKDGVIRVASAGGLLERPFLDLRPLVSRGSEQGLLGLAFHPDYVHNGLFYVNYTDQHGDSVVARYQVSDDPNVADPGTGTVILFQPQPFANHNGGNLVFGPDGYLWIGFGDGGSGGDPMGNGQNGATWLGKMLRIDVDGGSPYAIPADNPFVLTPGVLPEIWALGLRNPWRYSFDRSTGDLYIGDVGQNRYEEVDVQPAGQGAGWNYGWNIMEGNHCYLQPGCDPSPFVAPVAEYDHSRGDCAIVGGFVYRGAAFPALDGVYFFADECSGRLWSLVPDGAGGWTMTELLKTGVNISSFGEDQSGEVYVTGLNDGVVYRLTAV